MWARSHRFSEETHRCLYTINRESVMIGLSVSTYQPYVRGRVHHHQINGLTQKFSAIHFILLNLVPEVQIVNG